jgi:hypothetical protein
MCNSDFFQLARRGLKILKSEMKVHKNRYFDDILEKNPQKREKNQKNDFWGYIPV